MKRFLLIVCLLSVFAVPAASTAGTLNLTLLPLKNETGDASLGWLSLGLQDAITDDLWYVSGVRTLALPEYILTAGRTPLQLSLDTEEEALQLARRLSIEQIWVGSYRKGDGKNLLIEIRGLDVKTGKLIFAKTMRTSLDKLLADEPSFVIELLETIGVIPGAEEKSRFSGIKTKSIKAFELYAKAYEVQQELSLLRERERRRYYGEWLRLLREALKEDPQFAEAWNCLGWAIYTAEDHSGALNAFQKGLMLKPYMISSNLGMGYILRNKNDIPGAISYMEKAVIVNPALEWPKKTLEETVISSSGQNLPALLNYAKSGDKGQRIRAINALGKSKDPSVLPTLGKLLVDSDADLSYALLRAISEIGGKPAIPYLKEELSKGKRNWEITEMLFRIDKEEAMPYLIGMLEGKIKDEGSDLRVASSEMLGEMKAKQAVPLLIDAVKGYDSLAASSIRALAKMGDKAAIPDLTEALKKRGPEVRGEAALALGDLNAKDAMPLLIETAGKDKDQYVRLAAIISLASMGNEQAIKSLKDIVNKADAVMMEYAVSSIRKRPERFLNTELAFLFEKK